MRMPARFATRSRSGSLKLIFAMAVLGSTLGAPNNAIAQDYDYLVQAGALHPTNPEAPFEYTRFYPDVLQVHRGQTVRWEFLGNPEIIGGFHSVTFSADGRPPILRADELPGTYAFTEKWLLGSGCGHPGEPVCELDEDTEFLSSGVPAFEGEAFDVKVDLPPGTFGYVCTVHPAMKGSLQVVPDDEPDPLPTSDEIAAAVEEQIQADTEAADELFAADQVPVSTVVDGQRVWTVRLGDSTEDDHVSINAFMPSDLEIEAGDKTVFSSRERAANEVHTVTFPQEAALSGLQAFFLACDLDDPETGAPGIPGDFNPDNCPDTTEVRLHTWMTDQLAAPGNLVPTRATYHNSGMLIPPGAPDSFRKLPDTGRTLPSSFEAEFPVAGRFVYGCLIHEAGMAGSIQVG